MDYRVFLSKYPVYTVQFVSSFTASLAGSVMGYGFRLNSSSDGSDIHHYSPTARLDEILRAPLLVSASLAIKLSARYFLRNKRLPDIYFEILQVVSMLIIGLTWEAIEKTHLIDHIRELTNINFHPTQFGTTQDLLMDLTATLVTLLFVPLVLYTINKCKNTS